MKVLIACEESQAVTIEMRKLWIEAYSCDIQECSWWHPEWHIQGDVIEVLREKWDMIIAFPPCTDLSVSWARHFESKRKDWRQKEAIEFFMKFINADCDKIAIENPVNIIWWEYIKKWFPDLCEKYNLPIKRTQIIEPWQFWSSVTKKTCLWLKWLPNLKPTDIVDKWEIITFASWKRMHSFYVNSAWKWKFRSKTFPGIAKAIAEQWGMI